MQEGPPTRGRTRTPRSAFPRPSSLHAARCASPGPYRSRTVRSRTLQGSWLDTLFPPDGFGPTAARDSHGAFALTYTVPTSTPAGTYQIGARCGGGNIGVVA